MNCRHDWNVSYAQAKSIQERLSQMNILDDDFDDVKFVAGTDVGIKPNRNIACGAIVVLRYPELEVVDRAHACMPLEFPYIPGLLSFREVPVLIEAFKKLTVLPQMFLCDGQGVAHPRRFGLACHFGLLTDIPAIGVAKTRLIGSYEQPAIEKGSASILYYQDQQIGHVLRSRRSVSPIFVSPGHRVSFESAVRFALKCCTKYRLPETTRESHRFAAQITAKLDDCDA